MEGRSLIPLMRGEKLPQNIVLFAEEYEIGRRLDTIKEELAAANGGFVY